MNSRTVLFWHHVEQKHVLVRLLAALRLATNLSVPFSSLSPSSRKTHNFRKSPYRTSITALHFPPVRLLLKKHMTTFSMFPTCNTHASPNTQYRATPPSSCNVNVSVDGSSLVRQPGENNTKIFISVVIFRRGKRERVSTQFPRKSRRVYEHER